MSHPTATQMLEAVQLFLKEAEAELGGRLGFHAKVASNALGIVIREIAEDPDGAEAEAFADLGGVRAVCEGLRDGSVRADDRQVLEAIRAGALARLSVDNPRYATYARLKSRTL